MRQTNCDHRRGFTLVEILVVIAIIGVLLAFLLPALEKAREQANSVRCANNLSQIGMALLMYGQDNHGQFPRTTYATAPSITMVFDTGAAATDPFGAGGPQANDATADAFLLIRTLKLPTALMSDPYTDEIEFKPDPADPQKQSNFSDWYHNLAYSFADPYPDQNAVNARYRLDGKLPPDFVLAADRNPGTGANKNSRNHEGRGQNVLYSDGHVEWRESPLCGVNNDDIYVNGNNQISTTSSPLSPTDNMLVPAQNW